MPKTKLNLRQSFIASLYRHFKLNGPKKKKARNVGEINKKARLYALLKSSRLYLRHEKETLADKNRHHWCRALRKHLPAQASDFRGFLFKELDNETITYPTSHNCHKLSKFPHLLSHSRYR
jgi:hypothetical protein